MKNPFAIFPRTGYKNSQFQIVTSIDNLIIDFYQNEKLIKSLDASSKNPSLFLNFNITGKITAKCDSNGQIFQQEIEIKEALRLGTSEFKRAFIFDNSIYSFFLMKDRLLLYDEEKKIILINNNYSPTEIHKINNHYLFLTLIGSRENGICNLGLYCTETFEIISELLNDFREIKILPDSNKFWLHNIKSNTIHCYEITENPHANLKELINLDTFIDFFIDNNSACIYINYENSITVISLDYKYESIEITKTPKNAIDKLGNVFTFDNNVLTCKNIFTKHLETVFPDFSIKISNDEFIHKGEDIAEKDELSNLSIIVEEIKNDVFSKLSDTQSYYYHPLPKHQKLAETITKHFIYPTISGIYIIEEKTNRDFNGVIFNKNDSTWSAKPYTIENRKSSLLLLNNKINKSLINETQHLTLNKYHDNFLIVRSQNNQTIFLGSEQLNVALECDVTIFTVNQISYCLVKRDDTHTLYRAEDLTTALLDRITILNLDQFEKHRLIYYTERAKNDNEIKKVSTLDLKSCLKQKLYENTLIHPIFASLKNLKFFETIALANNNVVFNPTTLEIKDAFIGNIESHSKELNKILSHRTDTIYISIFNQLTKKYELACIPLETKKYKESYLSPDGQFLVLQDESNSYHYYDIKRNQTINFISGKFLEFRNDGSVVVEYGNNRSLKIMDPKTFEDITPPNYHYYRFVSPDGKLYAQVTSKTKYTNKLTNEEITVNELNQYRDDLDLEAHLFDENKDLVEFNLDKNRMKIFKSFKDEFAKLGIQTHSKINSKHIVQKEKFVEIGFVGTTVFTEIKIPDDTQFYNYAAFSFENDILGIVGKPEFGSPHGSLIMLCSLVIDYSMLKIEITQSMTSRIPKNAAWVCGFSKTGYFATYDSNPDTYLIKINSNLFTDQNNDNDLRKNIFKSKINIYNTYQNWNVIKNKNYLCFSPSGQFLALSEQGYEPLTHGGHGHIESHVLQIAETKTGRIINSLTEHGDKIQTDTRKKITFVAFSADEKKIMSLSKDGVIIIRDIDLQSPMK